jgi:replicative DNA helicase
LKTLEDYSGPDEIVTSQRLRHEFAQLPPHLSVCFKPRFFPSLVKACQGFQEGELIVISGPTKSGKTLLSQSLTYAFAQNDIDCLWFSYEVPTRQFIESFPDNMFPKFFLPREIHASNISWFEERTVEAWQKYGCRVVFVDHLHYLFDMARVRNPSLDIGAYARRIKRFAVANKLIVFLLTHITKVAHGEEITYSKIRDSSFIPQESDSVFLIRRLFDGNGEAGESAELKIEFHRRTGVLGRKIRLKKQHGYLWETADEVPF